MTSNPKSRRRSWFGGITRNVYLLGLLSMFNDFSADMISPLLPAFLASMGLGAGFLGIMEGFANSLSNITALFSGWADDRMHRSKRLTVLGYAICSLTRPFMGIPIPGVTLAARFLDRIGKGIRTAPRDRLLTGSLEKGNWGKAFGVQRAFDHAGALIGPPIAALLLKFYGFSYSKLFILASIPAILSILFVPLGIREAPEKKPAVSPRLKWRHLPSPLKRYILVIFLVAFSTPSELFLIMKLQSMGLATYQLPLAWGLLTACTLISSFFGGILADRWSQRRTIAVGWTLFVLVFLGFAFNQRILWAWFLVAIYGIQSGLVEASERAYPASVVPEEIRATALGWYYCAYGLGLLPASVLFGVLWSRYSPTVAFFTYAGMTLLVIPLLAWLPTHRRPEEKAQQPYLAALR
ncbi:MAG: MFS transporter [Deltaproteobacteria bacterium]|nr:MFS transporter [Deltaproteobacteria bacterium]